ncbi:MAG: hypothetical protein PVJ02_04605 [Gemmatimonadota bacterium]|jgi:hypothetical protein
MKHVAAYVVVPLLMWGCTQTGTEPRLEAASALGVRDVIPAQYAGESAGVVEAVTGSGQLHTPTSGTWRTFTIRAVKAVDGSVAGSFQWRAHMGKTGSKVKGMVTCFSVEGNQGWLAVLFEKAGNAANFGKWASIRVVDHGEGMDAPPDELGIRWKGFPGDDNDPHDFCAGQPTDQPVFPIEGGNIQIHH